MRLQYLFRSRGNKELVEAYNYSYDVTPTSGEKKNTVTRSVRPMRLVSDLGTNCWTVEFYFDKDDEEAARHLSLLHDEFMEYNPVVLLNEPAEYFARRLFPLVNEFEMKLRKFLFLSFALTEDATIWKTVKTLDEDDFYTIYIRLFTSKQFNKELYNLFPTNHPPYTKSNILQLIENIPEDEVAWDKVVGDKLQIIKHSFLDIKQYRNDVMHAHYISYSTYRKAKSLFKEVITQLTSEIDRMYQGIQFKPIPQEAIEETLRILGLYGDMPISDLDQWWINLEASKKAAIASIIANASSTRLEQLV